MKLGEALNERSELQARLGRLRDRLAASAVAQEGDEPPESPAELLAELERLASELERLIATINRTNAHSELPSGETLTAALAHRDVLGLRQGVLRAAVEATRQSEARYSRSELRLVRTIDVAALRSQIDELAKEQRELDTSIQQYNWTADLIE